MNAHCQRWISELSEHNFSIKYRPGVINRDADCLSHLSLNLEKYSVLCTETVEPDTFRAIMAAVEIQHINEESWLGRNNMNCIVDSSVRTMEVQIQGAQDAYYQLVYSRLK